MRLEAAIRGDLRRLLADELRAAERAVKAGVAEATTGLKLSLRDQVQRAALGRRLANTWRGDVYPRGSDSLSAAGHVYTKAAKIMAGFEAGAAIRGKDGLWLAVPTPATPKRVMGKRVTPALLEQAWGIRLRFIYRATGPSLLVADDLRAGQGKRGGFRVASERARRTGIGIASVVMFWLVRQVKMPKVIHFEPEARRWQARLPELVVRHWRDADGGQ